MIGFILQQISALSLSIDRENQKFDIVRRVVAIQYCHRFPHRLKRLGEDFGVLVVFKYGNKLERLPAKTTIEKGPCGKSGHDEFVKCESNIVYGIPLSCGKEYIGQSSRCVNNRLYEHRLMMRKKENAYSSLADHIKSCNGCTAGLEKNSILARKTYIPISIYIYTWA